jgi:hypothetical protein
MTTRDAAGGGGEGREGGGGVVSWWMCDVERLGMGSKLRVDSLEGRDWVGELRASTIMEKAAFPYAIHVS